MPFAPTAGEDVTYPPVANAHFSAPEAPWAIPSALF